MRERERFIKNYPLPPTEKRWSSPPLPSPTTTTPKGKRFLGNSILFGDLITIQKDVSAVAFIRRSQKIHSSAMCHKTKEHNFTKNPAFGGGRRRRRRKNFWPGPGPITSHLGNKYPVQAPPFTPTFITIGLTFGPT